MTVHQITLSAVFDDATNMLTLSGMGAPPPRPDDIPENCWFGQTGPGFEITMRVNRRDRTENPTAMYMTTGSDGSVRRYLVEYRNGAWQLPGVLSEG